jgi:hypothetical protein
VAASLVRPFIEREHYLHSMPAGPILTFGVFLGESLVGAAVFTRGARQGHRLLAAARPEQVVTLARFWLADDLPRNSESRVLAVVMRQVRRHTDYRLVLSYADPVAGHTGTIYRAAGWLYLGRTEPGGYVDLGDGRLSHPRSVFTRFGTNRIHHLRATGIPATRVSVPGKFRYAHMLDATWEWRLRLGAQPYPRPDERGPPHAR